MTKILKLFSLLLMFALSVAFADSTVDLEKYRLTVTEVDPEFHCFRLSNNMVFNLPKKNWVTETLPEVGTEVYIRPINRRVPKRLSCEEGKFGIIFSKNPDKKHIRVCMAKESEEYCQTYVSSEIICTVPKSFFVSAEYRYVITLSDGSRWIRVREGESPFSRGDRVIVSRAKENEFWIVNIDRSVSPRDLLRANDPFLWQEFVSVKPYDPEEITKE